MQPANDIAPAVAFVPLALEDEDIVTYAAIADGLGCSVEHCCEGFMLATPTAREAAIRLWQAILVLRLAGEQDAGQRTLHEVKAGKARGDLRAIIGLEPAAMPPEALVAAGLRYQH